MNTLSRLIEAKEKVRALRQATQNRLSWVKMMRTQRLCKVNKAVADLNRFENELKQVNRQAEQKGWIS